MNPVKKWAIDPAWRGLLLEIGFPLSDALRRAGLPGDLFGRADARLSTTTFVRLWEALEAEAPDPLFPIRLGSGISTETFDPLLFATLNSADLNAALGRVAQHARLLAPMTLRVKIREVSTLLEIVWPDRSLAPPPSLVATKLVFLVQLARMATGSEIRPLGVGAPFPPAPAEAYRDYFGVPVTIEPRPLIRFSADDAAKRSLSSGGELWGFFPAQLRARLADVDPDTPTAERGRRALLELLPGGAASVRAVASRLGISTRTLQRRLEREGTPFQQILAETRKRLALHYLGASSLSAAEIAFLLGYDDPNSFFRAFRGWTGATPERTRATMRR